MVEFWNYPIAAFISLALCSTAIAKPGWFTLSDNLLNDLTATQALHARPTPRIGGAAIVISLLVCVLIIREKLERDLLFALLAGAFVFFVGLREDIFRDISPRLRLIAAFASAALAIVLTGATVPGLGLAPLDMFLGLSIVSVLVTLLWSAGACHSLNLIDGLNGLAASYAIAAAAGVFAIAGFTGDVDIQIAASLLIAAVFGFLVVNWPSGRIFMGDAGAYAIGHILAWLCILLMVRNAEVVGCSLLLVLFWPVAETTYSIIRRKLRRRPADAPDRMHFHHLVVRAVPRIFGEKFRGRYDNSLAALLMIPLFSTPIIAGVLFWDKSTHAAGSLLFFTVLFIITYVAGVSYFRRFKRTRRNSSD